MKKTFITVLAAMMVCTSAQANNTEDIQGSSVAEKTKKEQKKEKKNVTFTVH